MTKMWSTRKVCVGFYHGFQHNSPNEGLELSVSELAVSTWCVVWCLPCGKIGEAEMGLQIGCVA